MKYFQCKCGDRKSWSTMGVRRCARCPKCGSDLAQGPSEHRDPEPHQMMEFPVDMQTDAGVVKGTITRCWWCLETKAELEKRGEPMVDKQP